jgi:hypothetical protein
MTLAVLDGATYYHQETIHGPRYRDRFDRVIYAPDLTAGDLADVTTLIVPDRISPTLLRRHRDLLNGFPAAGRTLVVLGENDVMSWLDGVAWSPRPTNFWWWLDPQAVPPSSRRPIIRCSGMSGRPTRSGISTACCSRRPVPRYWFRYRPIRRAAIRAGPCSTRIG